MNRYRAYGKLDDSPEAFGDLTFQALDMRSDPATLPPGTVAASENNRFDVNGTQVRGGCTRMFPPGTNVGSILFAGIYTPETGSNLVFALITANALVIFDPNDQSFATYFFPSGNTFSPGDTVWLVQAGVDEGLLPQLYLLHGTGESVMVFDGNTVAVDDTFPNTNFGLYYQDRIAAFTGLQAVEVSDFLDFTTWTLLNQFQIEQGGSDYLVGGLVYKNDNVLIGSRQKWFAALFAAAVTTDGYSGGLNAETSYLQLLTAEAGPVGPRASVEANGKIWFVSDNGIYAFVPQLDNTLTVLGKPISAPIEPVMKLLSTAFASATQVEVSGYRIYFALPISDDPIAVEGITVTLNTGSGIALPFTLPALLTGGGLATVETAAPHNLTNTDVVLVRGATDANLNGQFAVLGVPDETHFTYATNAQPGAAIGNNVTVQKLAQRNNTIAVYNLYFDAWESVDSLAPGVYADFLLTAEYGSALRLFIVDQALGPMLFEDGAADEIGTVVGGVTLPATLPFTIEPANYATNAIAGRVTTRTFRWGILQSGSYRMTAAYPRKIGRGNCRLTLQAGDAGTVTLHVNTPNRTPFVKSRSFPIQANPTYPLDTEVPLKCGKRGLEASLTIASTSGRPLIRSVEVETAAVGRVEDAE